MFRSLFQSVWTSVISASVASKHLKEGGLLQLTGAKAALGGTGFMIGYGMAKVPHIYMFINDAFWVLCALTHRPTYLLSLIHI